MGQAQSLQVSWTEDSWIPSVVLKPNDSVDTLPEDALNPPTSSDRPLPEEPLDPQVLATFQCPFQLHEESPFCSLKLVCPFGHHDDSQQALSAALRLLPQCFCMERLLNRCESVQLKRISPNDLVRCEFGFHPEPEHLLDPESFALKVAEALVSRSTKDWSEVITQPDCVACKKPIPTLWFPLNDGGLCGFLENCGHRFCRKCIEHWHNGGQAEPLGSRFTCPACHVATSRILLWPEPVCSPTMKAHLFAAQKVCFGMQVGGHTPVIIKEFIGEEQHFELQYKGHLFKGFRPHPRNQLPVRPARGRAPVRPPQPPRNAPN